jgi:hypothetical protein
MEYRSLGQSGSKVSQAGGLKWSAVFWQQKSHSGPFKVAAMPVT